MSSKFRTLSVATVALLSASGLAIAGGASQSSQQSDTSPGMQQQSGSTGMQQQGGTTSDSMSPGASGSASAQSDLTQDSITMTDEQKRTVFQQLSLDADTQDAPADFQASVGATLPSDIQLEEIPDSVSAQVPGLADHRFAKVGEDQLVIVDPNDRRVVSLLDQQEFQQQQGQTTQ